MLILAGLGNPGPRYAGNRHNVGSMTVDQIARRWSFGPERSRFQSLVREGSIETPAGPVRAMTLKPQTYYNDSGNAVGEALKFYTKADARGPGRLPRRDRPGARPLPDEGRRRRSRQ